MEERRVRTQHLAPQLLRLPPEGWSSPRQLVLKANEAGVRKTHKFLASYPKVRCRGRDRNAQLMSFPERGLLAYLSCSGGKKVLNWLSAEEADNSAHSQFREGSASILKELPREGPASGKSVFTSVLTEVLPFRTSAEPGTLSPTGPTTCKDGGWTVMKV